MILVLQLLFLKQQHPPRTTRTVKVREGKGRGRGREELSFIEAEEGGGDLRTIGHAIGDSRFKYLGTGRTRCQHVHIEDALLRTDTAEADRSGSVQCISADMMVASGMVHT